MKETYNKLQNWFMKHFYLAAIGILLSGCSAGLFNNRTITLEHPETGETRTCRASTLTTCAIDAKVEACAKDLEGRGFTRIPEK